MEHAAHDLVALVGFAFVGSVTPGPNNTVLSSSGLRFGFRRTLPHVVGTALGIGALVLAAALGLGALFRAVPALELALKIAGSLYLLWVAVRILGAHGDGDGGADRPFTVWHATAFQWANPKAWVFALVAVGTFIPDLSPYAAAVALLELTMMLVVAVSAAIWAASGTALGRAITEERTRRRVNVALAVVLVASVAFLWI